MTSGRSLEQSGNTELADIETELRGRIDTIRSLLSKSKLNIGDQSHFTINSEGELVFPVFSPAVNYNEEFWKTYMKNQMSFACVKEVSERTAELQQLSKKIEVLEQAYLKASKQKNKKKNRRLAAEIEKKFSCPYKNCYKYYGSDVSLNLHIKLKHNGGNKTDREKLAEQICLAELNQTPMPEIKLNLPPYFLEEYKKQNLFAERMQEKLKERREAKTIK